MTRILAPILLVVLLTFGSTSLVFGASISLYDPNGNYYYGTINGGNITFYDHDGKYYYGRLNGRNITLYDEDGNYYYGRVN